MDPSKKKDKKKDKDKEKDKKKQQHHPHPRESKEISTEGIEDEDLPFLSEIDSNKAKENDEKTERFDIASLQTDETVPDTKHFDEKDYQSHRKGNYPHTHQPVKNRNTRRKSSSSGRPSESDILRKETADISNDHEIEDGELKTIHDAHSRMTISSAHNYDDLIEETSPKTVKFEVGGFPIQSSSGVILGGHKRRHRHKTFAMRSKSNQHIKDSSAMKSDMPEGEMDKDDLTSHRYDHNRGFRRHTFQRNKITDAIEGYRKKHSYSYSPHEIFVELDMLSFGQDGEKEWKETARWIKYEEDLEEDAHRWGKPHISPLSFHSLINLKQLIETGVMMFDVEERDFPGIAYRVVEQLVIQELVTEENKGEILRCLLSRHKHVDDNHFRFHRKFTGSSTSLHTMTDGKNATTTQSSIDHSRKHSLHVRRNTTFGKLLGGENEHEQNDTKSPNSPEHIDDQQTQAQDPTPIPIESPINVANSKLSKNFSEDDMKWILSKESILRRIPRGAEATIVLVGIDDKLQSPSMAFVRLSESILMPHVTEIPIPVRFLFIVFGARDDDFDYKEIGRSIATLMSNVEFHEICYKSDVSRRDLLRGIHTFLNESTVLPPGDFDDDLFPIADFREKNQNMRQRHLKQVAKAKGLDIQDSLQKKPSRDKKPKYNPLKRSNILFGGLLNDVKWRYPKYFSDIKDAFNFQSFAAVIFIYFAAVSGAIAFGGLYYDKTDNNIGIAETLISTSIAGLIFSTLAGQPLLIIGATGPLLLFDEVFFQLCKSHDIDFLAMRFWIGIWLFGIGLTVACFEGGVLAKFFTRFIQEIFAALIAILFIVEALTNLYKIYVEHPLLPIHFYQDCKENDSTPSPDDEVSEVNQPNTALLSTILMFGTFFIALGLRAFRNSKYLNDVSRRVIGNFAVPIAIVMMVLIDFSVKNTKTQKLNVPFGFSPSNSTLRGWIVTPSNINKFMSLIAILPAFLVYILLFLETSISELLLGKKEQKLVKGCGFHLDVFILCFINTGVGIFGGPWINATILRTSAHASALTIYSTNNPPGEKPIILGVKEQRITGFVIALFVGLSMLFSKLLQIIPLAVIYGVFLFMGVQAFFGNEFFQRFSLLFKPVSNHPQVPFVRRVRTWKMHLFTLIQLILISTLWLVKSSMIALSLPFVLILIVPFRLYLLKYIFTPTELHALDDSEYNEKSPDEIFNSTQDLEIGVVKRVTHLSKNDILNEKYSSSTTASINSNPSKSHSHTIDLDVDKTE